MIWIVVRGISLFVLLLPPIASAAIAQGRTREPAERPAVPSARSSSGRTTSPPSEARGPGAGEAGPRAPGGGQCRRPVRKRAAAIYAAEALRPRRVDLLGVAGNDRRRGENG